MSNLLIAVGVALSIGTLIFHVSVAAEIFGDQARWSSGVFAVDGKVSGRRSTQKLFFHTYKLDVSYVDRAGTKHAAQTAFSTIGEPVKRKELRIKYDPRDPQRVVTSWAIENIRPRWYGWLVTLVGGLLLAAIALAIGRKLRTSRDILRLCAADSDEVLLEVLEHQRGSRQAPSSISSIRYAVPAGTGVRTGEVCFDRFKESPIYGDPGRGSILALVSGVDPAQPHVIMADLRQFELSREARREIDERLRQIGVEIVDGRCFPLEK